MTSHRPEENTQLPQLSNVASCVCTGHTVCVTAFYRTVVVVAFKLFICGTLAVLINSAGVMLQQMNMALTLIVVPHMFYHFPYRDTNHVHVI